MNSVRQHQKSPETQKKKNVFRQVHAGRSFALARCIFPADLRKFNVLPQSGVSEEELLELLKVRSEKFAFLPDSGAWSAKFFLFLKFSAPRAYYRFLLLPNNEIFQFLIF